jgi:hypothetical protein
VSPGIRSFKKIGKTMKKDPLGSTLYYTLVKGRGEVWDHLKSREVAVSDGNCENVENNP